MSHIKVLQFLSTAATLCITTKLHLLRNTNEQNIGRYSHPSQRLVILVSYFNILQNVLPCRPTNMARADRNAECHVTTSLFCRLVTLPSTPTLVRPNPSTVELDMGMNSAHLGGRMRKTSTQLRKHSPFVKCGVERQKGPPNAPVSFSSDAFMLPLTTHFLCV